MLLCNLLNFFLKLKGTTVRNIIKVIENSDLDALYEMIQFGYNFFIISIPDKYENLLSFFYYYMKKQKLTKKQKKKDELIVQEIFKNESKLSLKLLFIKLFFIDLFFVSYYKNKIMVLKMYHYKH